MDAQFSTSSDVVLRAAKMEIKITGIMNGLEERPQGLKPC